MTRKRTLPLLRLAFISLLAVTALLSAVNFVWLTETLDNSARTGRLSRALVDGYRQLCALAADPSLGGQDAVPARQAGLAAKSAELARRVAAASRHSIHAMVTLAVSSLGTIGAVLGIMALAGRRFARPLRLLLEAGERIADGDYTHRVPYEASDEMGTLVGSFNHMAQRLQRSLAETACQNQMLEARVLEATASLRALSFSDELTALPNLRFLRQAFAEAAARSIETGAPFALAFFDLEDFRSFNNALGREAGDQALIAVARCFRAAARGVDFVARYSGIRFAVLMPGVASVPGEFIERLEADVATVERLIRRHTDKDVALDLTAGAARFPADGQTLSALAAVADRSLQRNRGQNERGRAAAGAPALVHG